MLVMIINTCPVVLDYLLLYYCVLLYNFIVLLEFSKWEIWGTLGVSLGKVSCDRVALPNLQFELGFSVFPLSTELWNGLQDL